MHELHLMRQVVRMVEEACHDQPGSVPAVIRLQVSRHSHLADHNSEELEATFQIAAQGSLAEKARLEISLVAPSGECTLCGRTVEGTQEISTCPSCGSENIQWEKRPEVLLQEVECLVEES